MKKETMIDLIKMYDAVNKIDDVHKMLFGSAFSLGIDDGIFGTMTRIYGIIRRECNQDLVDDEMDLEDNQYHQILISDVSAEERADFLLRNIYIPGYIKKECLQMGDKLKAKINRWSTFIIVSIKDGHIITDEGTVHPIEKVPELFYYINKDKTYKDII